MRTTFDEQYWLDLITKCRASGLSDRQWCIQNSIAPSTFYYHVKTLRKKASELPASAASIPVKQEVVQLPVWCDSDVAAEEDIRKNTPTISLTMRGVRIEIQNHACAEVIHNTILALQQLC